MPMGHICTAPGRELEPSTKYAQSLSFVKASDRFGEARLGNGWPECASVHGWPCRRERVRPVDKAREDPRVAVRLLRVREAQPKYKELALTPSVWWNRC